LIADIRARTHAIPHQAGALICALRGIYGNVRIEREFA
jgi:hypothetical protein